MIEKSSDYGLYNPAFCEDIGQAKLSQIGANFSAQDFEDYRISGVTGSMEGVKMQGNLKEDTFGKPSSKSKRKNIVKGILIGIGILTTGLLGWKFKGKLKDLGVKISNGFKSVLTKIKK